MLQRIHSGSYFKTHMLTQRIHFRWCCQRVHPWHPGRRPCIFVVWQFLLAFNQVTFVLFFSAVYFQMSLQRTWVRASKVTLVIFFWLSPRCIFKRFLKLPAWKQVISHCLHLFGCLLCIFKCSLKALGSEEAKSHWLHVFYFSPLCIFKCFLKSPTREDAKSHWLHLLSSSPLCVFKWVLKLPALEEAKSHWLHLFVFSPLCVFKCVLKSPAWEDAYTHWLHLFDFSLPSVSLIETWLVVLLL